MGGKRKIAKKTVISGREKVDSALNDLKLNPRSDLLAIFKKTIPAVVNQEFLGDDEGKIYCLDKNRNFVVIFSNIDEFDIHMRNVAANIDVNED
ncbi:hypothetical protein [Pacificoceanicola onchidii]|uniref:hypothetical protein n=1 Tax=Pacificoceanicola onchidii TaxID=2562685 RepID=UPI0010A43ABC|nr:hypothetical protein [Pacificoceanicola onchidii]